MSVRQVIKELNCVALYIRIMAFFMKPLVYKHHNRVKLLNGKNIYNSCIMDWRTCVEQNWDNDVVTVVHLLSRMPSKVLNFTTPLQVLSSHVSLPSVLLIPPRVFRCVTFVHLPNN